MCRYVVKTYRDLPHKGFGINIDLKYSASRAFTPNSFGFRPRNIVSGFQFSRHWVELGIRMYNPVEFNYLQSFNHDNITDSESLNLFPHIYVDIYLMINMTKPLVIQLNFPQNGYNFLCHGNDFQFRTWNRFKHSRFYPAFVSRFLLSFFVVNVDRINI